MIRQKLAAIQKRPVQVFVGLLFSRFAAAFLRQSSKRRFGGKFAECSNIKRGVGVVAHLGIENFEVGTALGVFDQFGKIGVGRGGDEGSGNTANRTLQSSQTIMVAILRSRNTATWVE